MESDRSNRRGPGGREDDDLLRKFARKEDPNSFWGQRAAREAEDRDRRGDRDPRDERRDDRDDRERRGGCE